MRYVDKNAKASKNSKNNPDSKNFKSAKLFMKTVVNGKEASKKTILASKSKNSPRKARNFKASN
jgi:hypothetical protein